MMRIRCLEETVSDLYQEQEMRTPTHLSIEQEAVAVGVCSALEPSDVLYSNHRSHAHYLAKSGDLLGLVGELYGKEFGCSGGCGGSVHLRDVEAGVIASSAIFILEAVSQVIRIISEYFSGDRNPGWPGLYILAPFE